MRRILAAGQLVRHVTTALVASTSYFTTTTLFVAAASNNHINNASTSARPRGQHVFGTRTAPLSSSSSSSSSDTSSSSSLALASPYVVSSGLENLGNTCYLNAQLQCAFHIPQVRELILNDVPLVEHEGEPLLVEPGPPLQALRITVKNMITKGTTISTAATAAAVARLYHKASKTTNSQSAAVSPRILCLTLGINPWEQQDSQEFWKLLLPLLQLSRLTALYRGRLENAIVALDGSGRSRQTAEDFWDLSLPLVSASTTTTTATTSASTTSTGTTTTTVPTVMDSLRELVRPEPLWVAEGNGWRPAKGEPKVDASRFSRITHWPAILQLHLKRFQYNPVTQRMSKLNEPLVFPLEMNVAEILQEQSPAEEGEQPNTDIVAEKAEDEALWYDLHSVVVHCGDEWGGGHYYSYVRPQPHRDPHRWYRCDDTRITPVTFRQVVEDATGGLASVAVAATASSALTTTTRQNAVTLSFPSWVPGWLHQGLSSLWWVWWWTRSQAAAAVAPPSSAAALPYGYGGHTANAYVLQYVQRNEGGQLFGEETAKSP